MKAEARKPLMAQMNADRDTQGSPHKGGSSGVHIRNHNPVEFDGVKRHSNPGHRWRTEHEAHSNGRNVDHTGVNSGGFAIVGNQAGNKRFIQSKSHLRPSAPSAVDLQEGDKA